MSDELRIAAFVLVLWVLAAELIVAWYLLRRIRGRPFEFTTREKFIRNVRWPE